MSQPVKPRRVTFDWEQTPLHWIPDEPTATHVINVLHLLLPAGERWLVKVFKETLPLVTDEQLLKDVKGFMGQEATQSMQHAYVLEHLAEQDLDATGYTRHVEWMFDVLLGEKPPWGAPIPRREGLRFRLSLIAAIEHFTGSLGDWILDARALEGAGTDEVMLDLLRWHGGGGGRAPGRGVRHVPALRPLRRAALPVPGRGSGAGLADPVLSVDIRRPLSLRHDPQRAGGRYRFGDHRAAARRGLLPSWASLNAAMPRYLRRSYHPSQEGSLRKAVEYLAVSPAAQAAGGTAGRAAAS